MTRYHSCRSPTFLVAATLGMVLIGGATLYGLPTFHAVRAAAVYGPPYGATVDTVFDIVRANDPTAFLCMHAVGQSPRQIWDKRVDGEPFVEAYLFRALYVDGTAIEIAINPEFGSEEAARQEAEKYVRRLGQLPTALRAGVRRFSVHKGAEGFHAGAGQIVMYADQADQRIENELFAFEELCNNRFVSCGRIVADETRVIPIQYKPVDRNWDSFCDRNARGGGDRVSHFHSLSRSRRRRP